MVAKQKSHYSKKCCNCPRSPLFNQSLCMTGIDTFIITHGNWAEKNIPPCAVFNWLQVTCCRSWLLYVRHVLIPFTKHSEFKIGERTQSDMVGNGIDRFKWQRPFTRRKIASASEPANRCSPNSVDRFRWTDQLSPTRRALGFRLYTGSTQKGSLRHLLQVSFDPEE